MNLFKRALVFTDLHFGNKSNSLLHNQDCEAFVDWTIQLGRSKDCDICLFLGDWHHHRSSINLHTLNYSLRTVEKLSAAFDRTIFIPGNHDLYYRDRRDVHSIEWIKHLPNIQICNDFYQEGDAVFAPWLVGDDYKKLSKMNARYLFGHFELPHFKMNAMVEMPDHGELSREDLGEFGSVFSGHFHMRQAQRNITYIGNAFPHNFADAGDTERGCMILEWGAEPEYHAWTEQPLYRVCDLSTLIDSADSILRPKMHVRVNLDIEISYEEANYIKEQFIEKYSLRELSLIPNKRTALETSTSTEEIRFESVDQIITDQLTKIDSEFYDNQLLLKIYQTL